MKKFLRISFHLIKINIEKDLIYSFNTWFLLFTTFFYSVTFLLSLKFVFMQVDSILGYSFEQLAILTLGGQLFWYVHVVFVRKSMQNLADLIHEGKLDMMLVKPVSMRRIIPFLEFDQRHVLPSILASGVIAYFLRSYDLSVIQIIGIIGFFINGMIISFFITLIFVTFTFWSGRNDAVFNILMSLVDILRLPMSFFPGFLKPLFFVIPAIPILNPSLQIINGRVDTWLIIVSLLITSVLFIIAEFMWRLGLKNYTSAN